MTRYLSEEQTLKAIEVLQKEGIPFYYDYEKHRIIINDQNGQEIIYLRLPLTIPPIQDLTEFYDPVHYVILLIQSGSSAVAFCEGDEMIDHKVFKSYMVRKKQGKSQVKYLKTKGKSRAGSRVRLANTLDFFENINERLQDHFEDYTVDRIALSCSKTLIPYLFNSKVPCPFDKKDERIYKIPRHIPTPGYDILVETHGYLQQSELMYYEENHHLISHLTGF
ncbi:hypothetical protein C900_02386 [Fulvivirga imtechensis AK7]|uniref:VLRF1 domain-containing protein n=1 Tax=Fulvivirga imtechensis AK7 TaxID=1237149 RepID=L8JS05_9BACT|nr:hypothetical protein [Fulvivirga imtechensis]ELR71650.1 hypothetical protein C900_02386 [Fulvivirga imtechensis AK7]